MVSKPWNVIPTSRSIEDVQANLFEIPMRTLTSDYFQEQNDFERQIQAVTFTVDTSNPQNQQALTNTATGARIKFFESNIVIDDKRKAFERGLQRLAYKLLNRNIWEYGREYCYQEARRWVILGNKQRTIKKCYPKIRNKSRDWF